MDASWIPFSAKVGDAVGYLSFLVKKRIGSYPTPGQLCGSLVHAPCHDLYPIPTHSQELAVTRPASASQTLIHFSGSQGQLFATPLVRSPLQHCLQVDTQYVSPLYPSVIYSLFGGTYCSFDVVAQSKSTDFDVISRRNSAHSAYAADHAVFSQSHRVDDSCSKISDGSQSSDGTELFHSALSHRSLSAHSQDWFPRVEGLTLDHPGSDPLCLHWKHCYPYSQHTGRSEQLNAAENARVGASKHSLQCYQTIFETQILDMTVERMTSPSSEHSLYELSLKCDWLGDHCLAEKPHRYCGNAHSGTLLHERCLPELPPGHLEVSICDSVDGCSESDTLEIPALLTRWCSNSPYPPEYVELSELFVQNSAADWDSNSVAVSSEPTQSASTKPSAAVHQTGSNNDTGSFENALNQEGRVDSLVPTLSVDKIHETLGLGIASAHSPELNSQELQFLNEVPPEFAAAELRLRRALRTEQSKLELESARTSPIFSRQKSYSETPKRSSILVRYAEDTVNRLSIFKRTPSGTDGPTVSSPKLHRTSLSMVRPPQRPLFARDQDSVDDGVGESGELGSRITTMSWATIDSTDVSRGMKLVDFGIASSSSEALDNFEKSKDVLGLNTTKDEAVQFELMPLSSSSIPQSVIPSQSKQVACNITPSIHYCDLGQIDKELYGLHYFPRFTTVIARLRKFAMSRTRAKYERFPFITNKSAFGIFLNFGHKNG
ncbi:unnamed protein product [Dicrocoelium dendriticum]|nr:unnamed protein product [Dicrocoelium dendriticum]